MIFMVSIWFYSKKYKGGEISNQFNVRQINYLAKVSTACVISLNKINLDRAVLKNKARQFRSIKKR